MRWHGFLLHGWPRIVSSRGPRGAYSVTYVTDLLQKVISEPPLSNSCESERIEWHLNWRLSHSTPSGPFTNGWFKPKTIFVSGQRRSLTMVSAWSKTGVSYWCDHCCQRHLTSSHGRYRDLFAVVDVSLKQRPTLCFYCSKNDPKECALA